ncbi:hypothetical protein [Paracoccus spongiarum]|uniref:Uncharacterized protein n=1 Tax=Paracoccus spongiarum TaxID=3064387 RepID=A0ABT9JBT1_9RHOB|nr:hypothetical protein [Paracoccus sp. 2205BS29-5]MDP5307175.1 hypothetical protein [Paracoccus sp. 2205BS29-5]
MDSDVKERVQESQAAARSFLAGADAKALATSTYDCTVSIGAAGGGYLNVDFKTNGNTIAQFQGGFAGGFGGYTGWGKAWFNTPVEGLIGKSGAFVVEVVGIIGGTAHVQITGDGFIGNCSTGGIGAGGGVGAGGGSFKAA